MTKVLLNNSMVSSEIPLIHCNDRGLLLGDGIFETIKVENGHLLFFEKHYIRLVNSARKLFIPFIISQAELFSNCLQVLKANDLSVHASLRITLTRGQSSRGINIPAEQNPTLLISAAPYSTQASPYISAWITDVRRNEYSVITSLKTLNYLESIIARQQAMNLGYDEGIMLNTKLAITETSIANLFIVKNDTIKTPRLSDGVLPGIVREVILEVAGQNNILVEEVTLYIDDIFSASEIFQTNSLIGIQSISRVNNAHFPIGESAVITQKIKALYAKER